MPPWHPMTAAQLLRVELGALRQGVADTGLWHVRAHMNHHAHHGTHRMTVRLAAARVVFCLSIARAECIADQLTRAMPCRPSTLMYMSNFHCASGEKLLQLHVFFGRSGLSELCLGLCLWPLHGALARAPCRALRAPSR